MKKVFFSLLTFCALSASAQSQIETFSVYDVNHDAAVTKEDDAATVNWGAEWQMPSNDQLTELRAECTWKWSAEKIGINPYPS